MRASPASHHLKQNRVNLARAQIMTTQRTSAPIQTKPSFEDHGLPSCLDLDDYVARDCARKEKAKALVKNSAIFFGILFGLSFTFAIDISMIGIWTGLITGLFVAGLFSWLASLLPISMALAFKDGDLGLGRKVENYLRAFHEWEYHNETTGVGFWREMRGQNLENATAKLFRQRGWRVATTAVTGDGGVDLILENGGSKIWCQCKGYANKVSVAAVREIAGVCSASHATPMLIVVNGITGPALAEAQKYSVIIWDSEELAEFARGGMQPKQ